MTASAPNHGHATHLTAPMLQALHNLSKAHPGAGMVPSMSTAVALLNRGFITKAVIGEHVSTASTYNITLRGLKAYRIEQSLAGVDAAARAAGA